jgi:hypothetical protein
MDLQATIRKLEMEKASIELALTELRKLQNGNGAILLGYRPGLKLKRGRKSMGSEERQEVSLRMKKYWAGQRLKDASGTADQEGGLR